MQNSEKFGTLVANRNNLQPVLSKLSTYFEMDKSYYKHVRTMKSDE